MGALITDPGDVILRPFQDADSDALFRWINDRSTVIFNAPFVPVPRSHHESWFLAIRKNPTVRIFAIETVPAPVLIGSCQLLNIAWRQRSADLQIRIGEPSFRDRGLGTKAVKNLLAFGFEELGLVRIALTVRSDNTRAIRAYQKCGFVCEGLRKDAVQIEGRPVDLLCMGARAR